MSFRFGVMSEEFIGSARYSRYKMAGRQFGWYRGFSRPLGVRGFFITRLHSGKLGGTAKSFVPWDESFFFAAGKF